MKNLLIIMLLFTFLACNSTKTTNNKVNINFENENSYDLDIYKIQINDYTIKWDNKLSDFIEDSNYNELHQKFENFKDAIISLIGNEELTSANCCGYSEKLAKGDLAFLLINKMKPIPLFEQFHIQFDFYVEGCKYPNGLILWVNENRNKVVENLIGY